MERLCLQVAGAAFASNTFQSVLSQTSRRYGQIKFQLISTTRLTSRAVLVCMCTNVLLGKSITLIGPINRHKEKTIGALVGENWMQIFFLFRQNYCKSFQLESPNYPVNILFPVQQKSVLLCLQQIY